MEVGWWTLQLPIHSWHSKIQDQTCARASQTNSWQCNAVQPQEKYTQIKRVFWTQSNCRDRSNLMYQKRYWKGVLLDLLTEALQLKANGINLQGSPNIFTQSARETFLICYSCPTCIFPRAPWVVSAAFFALHALDQWVLPHTIPVCSRERPRSTLLRE